MLSVTWLSLPDYPPPPRMRSVYDCVTLDKVFLKFMASSNHMLIAHEPPPDMEMSQMTPITQTRVTGLITLEVRAWACGCGWGWASSRWRCVCGCVFVCVFVCARVLVLV